MQTLLDPGARPESIVIATGNSGKVAEIRDLLRGVPVSFAYLADHPSVTEVDESGHTFAQNAELKAVGYARQTNRWCLADDSGLEVRALGGRPGVLSARYGGPTLTYSEKMALLLQELDGSGNDDRAARFACAMVVADETGRIRFSAEGECRGRIALAPRGTGGFGFDPIFIPEGFDRTFGELPESVKARISHRALAADKIMRYLLDFIGVST